jgi:alkanesulfonate monooxygenase SsuD/methylene tetrahydromethanopterin reductase-like flavin-dependent oxidoreductase (luciferase family)/hemerythrin-like domain-containing protein
MTDYGHDLLFGSFITPSAGEPELVVELAQLSERAGLDLVTVQDHPYLPAFLDAWTLLAYLAAVTSRIRLAPNVINLPLREPAVLARSAASLDLLSGGRVELGLGAGAFWEAIEANGGRRLAPGQALAALGEAIEIIRQVWDVGQRGGVRISGSRYRLAGAKRGPGAVHQIGIWVGGYKPRMLELIGRAADGWLPSLSYLEGGIAQLPDLNARIDEAAAAAGRDPRAVRRLLNISGEFSAAGAGFLAGPAAQWAEELAGLALDCGISGFILAGDDPVAIQRFGQEVAPAVRDLVAAERADPGAGAKASQDDARGSGRGAVAGAFAVSGASGSAQEASRFWDESARPVAPPAPPGQQYSARGQAVGRHLSEAHDHLRRELGQIRDLLEQVKLGSVTAGAARAVLNQMTMRQNNWTLGAYCAAYCTLITQHHGLEDRAVFPHLRRADPGLVPVIDRLEQEHVIIHEVVDGVDRALVNLVARPDDFTELQEAVDALTDALRSHLAYEEQQITEPLSRLGFFPGQV